MRHYNLIPEIYTVHMNFKIVDIQKDRNLNCYSVLTVVNINDFMEFIESIHENRGNIDEQRDVLSTRSAKIIRNQMAEDLKGGGILPPIVLGSIYDLEINDKNFSEIIKAKQQGKEISILDGMQRIQAIKDALQEREINHNLRVEFWFAYDESALLYRMLILNSGQIPWGLDKQLEVVFKPILKQLKQHTYYSESLYSSSDIVELFLAFTSRKVKIDKKQQLAEYHSALDIMSLIRDRSGDIISKFERIFELMNKIHILFEGVNNRYVFDNQAVRISFIVACAEKIFGLLGNGEEKNHAKVERNFEQSILKLSKIIHLIDQKSMQERIEFLSLDLLKDMLRPIPKEKHRQAFLDGFKVLFSESEINSFAVCWNRMY